MKKIVLYTSMVATIAGLASCNEDFNEGIAQPQSWEQEEMVAVAELSVTAAEGINLEEATGDSVQFINYSVSQQLSGSSLSNFWTEVSKPESNEVVKLATNANGMVSVEELQSIIEDMYGKKAEERLLNVSASLNMSLDGETVLIKTKSPITVSVMPKTPVIIPEYYIVGSAQGWSDKNKTCAFYPTDIENSIFTYTTDFSNNGAGDPNFKVWAASDFGDWSKALGTATDGDTSLEGAFVENGGAIKTPTNEIYTVTIDLINMKYKMVKEENQSPAVYEKIGLIGEFNNWEGDLEMTQSAPHNWYYNGFEAEGKIKFRANGGWDVSWGENINIGETSFGTGILGSNENLTLPKGIYDVFFNDITGQFVFYAR